MSTTVESHFASIFKTTSFPVIVCRNTEQYPIVFANVQAHILLNPHFSVTTRDHSKNHVHFLHELLKFNTSGTLEDILTIVANTGSVNNYKAAVIAAGDNLIFVSLFVHLVHIEDESYIVIYVNEVPTGDWTDKDFSDAMSRVLKIAYHSASANEAIQLILSAAGQISQVSRAYIFEEVSAELTRNTYEWCSNGTEPAIDQLQNLSKADYQYNEIIQAGVFICNNIQELSESEFEILNAQGIKSLAIIPMCHLDRPLGYVGFDDCEKHRVWRSVEIELLHSIADILASLIIRRENEDQVFRSYQVLQTISDNTDNIIYASDLATYKLLFVNKALADALNTTQEALIGQPCWKVLQAQEQACSWCPLPKVINNQGKSHTWEYQNRINHHWYIARDAIIPWVDGRAAHIETATEITHKKQHEAELEYFASTDSLTGVYNREWGYRRMEELLQNQKEAHEELSLCFIDLDGLKQTNDRLGHEAGDDMIRFTVATIRKNTRKTDLLFRWGGDEFILLLQCSLPHAEKVILNIQNELDAVNAGGEKPFQLSFSYGIVDFRLKHGEKLDDLINSADQKMYGNKLSKGRHRQPRIPPVKNLLT